MISSIYFDNFKALEKFSISLKEFNILVGVNNSGKSTILDALRILQGAYRYASRYNPQHINLPDGRTVLGWEIPDNSIPILLENIQTNFSDEPAIIKYRFNKSKFLYIYFFKGRQTILSFDVVDGVQPKTASSFRKEFNFKLAVVPTLAPFEIEEDIVDNQYLKRWEGSRRASRLFRNIWYQNDEFFDEFQKVVSETWPGMSISLPEKQNMFSKRLTMFFQENRITREICWAGFGFQVWLQLLTHIIKNKNADIIVVDEPEIYLHPDLQHKILQILHNTNACILLATHSAEIINEAEPNEVLAIDRNYKSAKRLSNLSGLQKVINIIGSNQNINLTRLARGKRILFVEGKDIKLLKKLAKVAGYEGLFDKYNLTVIPIEGFSQNERVSGTNWTFSKIISEEVKIMALFDRDYRCDEEITDFIDRLKKDTTYIHVLKRKEIENYFLNIKAIYQAINNRLKSKNKNELIELPYEDVRKILFDLTEGFKREVSSQLAAFKYKYISSTGKDLASIIKEEQDNFEINWENLEYRFQIIPGKEFISTINRFLLENFKISITYNLIGNYIDKSELENDIVIFFDELIKNAS